MISILIEAERVRKVISFLFWKIFLNSNVENVEVTIELSTDRHVDIEWLPENLLNAEQQEIHVSAKRWCDEKKKELLKTTQSRWNMSKTVVIGSTYDIL